MSRERTESPDITLHPLGIELLVNCAECGSILQAELCNHDERAFGKQILITVARCACDGVGEGPTGCADDSEYELGDALKKISPERLDELLNETLADPPKESK